MDYYEIHIPVDASLKDVLVVELEQLGYTGFWEQKEALVAYIPQINFNHEGLKNLLNGYQITSFDQNVIENANWNKAWEANFEPVALEEDSLVIRAPFHKKINKYQHELLITPKMSFGTGHHPTTLLMLKLQLYINFKGKEVLDHGTGTGVLAILGEQQGAANILAIDNNPFSVSNTLENIALNNCEHIQTGECSIEELPWQNYDVILANITRNVILESLPNYKTSLKSNGDLLLSGFIERDLTKIKRKAQEEGFICKNIERMGEWLGMHFVKEDN